jgi:hypothetical protein
MDPGVAVRASCIEGPGHREGNSAARLGIYPVALMTLEAEEGLPRLEKPAVDRTMGAVTVETVLHHIGMFIKERASLVGMTLDTGFLDRVLEKISAGESPVRIVTVNAKYPPFLEGVVAGQEKLRLGGLMTGKTQFACCQRGDFQIRTGVNIMAGKTGYFVKGMQAGVPVMQVKGGIGGVALEADQ